MVVKNLLELSQIVEGRLSQSLSEEGAELKIEGVTGLDGYRGHHSGGWITFAENQPSLDLAEEANFAALLLPEGLTSRLPYITVKNPRLAFAELLNLYHPRTRPSWGQSSQALIAPSASIAETASIGPTAIIGENCQIEEKVEIWPGAQIGDGCRVGSGSRLLPGVILEEHCQVGSDCLIGANTWLGAQTIIGDNVEIGARCCLDSCQIASGARLDNMIVVEKEAQVGPLAIVISHSLLKEACQTKTLSICASQALIDSHCTLGSGATAAGRSHVDKDIPDGRKIYSGDPIVTHTQDMRRQAQRQLALKHRQELGL